MIVVLDIPAGGDPDLVSLFARLDAASFEGAQVRAVAPSTYEATKQLIAQCDLGELRRLTMHDLAAINRKVGGRSTPGPQGKVGKNAVPEK